MPKFNPAPAGTGRKEKNYGRNPPGARSVRRRTRSPDAGSGVASIFLGAFGIRFSFAPLARGIRAGRCFPRCCKISYVNVSGWDPGCDLSTAASRCRHAPHMLLVAASVWLQAHRSRIHVSWGNGSATAARHTSPTLLSALRLLMQRARYCASRRVKRWCAQPRRPPHRSSARICAFLRDPTHPWFSSCGVAALASQPPHLALHRRCSVSRA